MFVKSKRFISSNESSKSDEEDEPQAEFVRVCGTEVYFTGEVCQESVLELNIALRKLQGEIMIAAAKLGMWDNPPGITLFINSAGGCVFSGLSALDHIRTSRVPVTTVVDGCCCSSATFLLIGGHKRLMKENSFVLIHQISNGFWGKYEEMKDEMDTTQKLMDHITNVYRRETNITEKKLKKFMKRDVYLNSQECIDLGIVSGVFGSLALKSAPEDKYEDGDNE